MPIRPPVEGTRSSIADESALFTPDYVRRTEQLIPIQKNELRMMGSLNSIAIFCFSIASGIGFQLVGFLWDASADGQITRNESPWIFYASVGFLIFLIGGIWAVWRRKTDIDYIWKNRSQ